MVVEAQAPSPRRLSRDWTTAEQSFYVRSPLGARATTAAIFVVLVGTYSLAAWADHIPWIVRSVAGADVDRRAWIAVCLTLIVCAVLGLQRYSQLMEARDAAAFARAVRADVVWAPTFSRARLRLFTVVGLVLGAVVFVWFLTPVEAARNLATSAWFTIVAMLLSALFFRGIVMTGSAARHTRRVVQSGLNVDLLRIEQLYPFGRAAGRTALVWFTVSAAVLLLFMHGGLSLATIALGVVCAAMGVWVFVGTLNVVHHEIRKAKAAELEGLRTEIAVVKQALDADPAAPAKLQSLLAYEARIDAAPEWPFDQTTLVRVGASALILTVPWFGQAIAGLVVDHLGKGLS